MISHNPLIFLNSFDYCWQCEKGQRVSGFKIVAYAYDIQNQVLKFKENSAKFSLLAAIAHLFYYCEKTHQNESKIYFFYSNKKAKDIRISFWLNSYRP